jgi:hypothetical protein
MATPEVEIAKPVHKENVLSGSASYIGEKAGSTLVGKKAPAGGNTDQQLSSRASKTPSDSAENTTEPEKKEKWKTPEELILEALKKHCSGAMLFYNDSARKFYLVYLFTEEFLACAGENFLTDYFHWYSHNDQAHGILFEGNFTQEELMEFFGDSPYASILTRRILKVMGWFPGQQRTHGFYRD